MKTGFWNFKTKLMLMFTVIAVIPLIVVGLLVNRDARDGINQQTKAGISGLVRSLERETISHVAMSEKVVKTLAKLPVMKTSDYVAQRNIFSAVLKDNPQFLALYIGYANQTGLPNLVPPSDLPPDFDARKRPWYIKAAESDEIQITDVYIDTSTKSPIVTICKSLKDANGNVIGVLGADVNLASLSDMVAQTKLGKEGYAYILDKNGVTLAHPNKEQVKNQVNFVQLLPFTKRALDGEEGYEIYTYEGIEKICGFKRVDKFGWGVFVQQPTSEAFSAIDKISSNLSWAIIIAILAALSLGFVFAQSVSKRVRVIAQAAAQVAKGDMTVELKTMGKDELGVLTRSFNDMIGNVRNLLKEVTGTAATVNSSSQDLTAHAQQAAATTEEIANAIDETIRVVEEGAKVQNSSVNSAQEAMRELSLAVNQIAQGAQEQAANVNKGAEMVTNVANGIQEVKERMMIVDEAAKLNRAKAEEGGQVVTETVQGMEEIKKVVFEAAIAIRDLGNSSKQIGEIIEVIDDIAEQTNLLALNAAIEAARAGDHGKGFAVVADEVRKLAERSGKSTQEIRQLIQFIQKTTGQAVTSIESGTAEVEKGSAMAYAAGEALQEIVAMARKSDAEVQAITKTIIDMREQGQAVVQAMDNLAGITEENTASTEEMAAGSDNVLSTIENIAQATTDSANAVRQVSDSSSQLKVVSEQVALSASGLAAAAEKLNTLVGKFKV